MEAIVNGLGVETELPEVSRDGGLVRVRAVLRGTSPLLMNAIPAEQLLLIRDGKKGAKTKAKPTLREEAESKLHLSAAGRLVLPGEALYKAMINAGVFVRLDGKRQVSTKAETTLPGFMILEEMDLPLYLHDSDEEPKWEIDIRRGRNPNGGELVCLVRPRVDQWEVRPTFQVDQETFSLALAHQVVEFAGKRIGVLEFRPSRKGLFGRFIIVGWKVL
jgi:hypothetical protein